MTGNHANGGSAASSRTTDITTGQGGVMTDEVGVITGRLTLRTELDNDLNVKVTVQYKDADEWYAVTNARTALREAADIDAVHSVVVGLLDRPSG